MKNLFIEQCDDNNLDTLIDLRRRQLKEENINFRQSDIAIEQQLNEMMANGCQAFFLKWENDIVGFAIIDTKVEPFSLKYFYASRNFRRSGMKVLDFRKLIDLLDTDALEVKVNARNNSSRLFWETFGFKEQTVSLRFIKTKLLK